MGNSKLNKPGQEATQREIYTWIAALGEQYDTSSKEDVAKYLSHASPSIRRVALSTLVLHWGLVEFEPTCRLMLDDADPEVQAKAVSCVVSLHEVDISRTKTGLIVSRLLRDPKRHWIVRASCYYHIQKAMNIAARNRLNPRDGATLERNIDWDLVERFEQLTQDNMGM